jgi:hypothetical protein
VTAAQPAAKLLEVGLELKPLNRKEDVVLSLHAHPLQVTSQRLCLIALIQVPLPLLFFGALLAFPPSPAMIVLMLLRYSLRALWSIA